MCTVKNKRQEHGFVLPMTLIVLALLTVLSMGLSQMARSTLSDVQQRKLLLERELQFKSASQWVMYQLLTGKPTKRGVRTGELYLPVDGRAVRWDGVSIRVQDGAGLLGLGLYNQGVFQAMAEGFVDKKSARRLAAQLGDWVDGDQLPRYQGMEAADYLKAGLPMLPRNAPIRTLEELLELPEMTEALFEGNAEHAGLRSLLLAGGESHFNVATAPTALLGPVLGYSGSKLQQVIDMRKKQRWGDLGRLLHGHRLFFETPPFQPGSTFRLLISDGSDFSVRAIYSIIPGKIMPYTKILWQYPHHDRG